LSFEDETDRRRKPDTSPAPEGNDLPTTRKKRGPNAEVGHALRAAYRQAVDEDIPPELLDLLGKLG
jgi:hypothetical protein